jgi:hypothetical protein
MAMLIECNFENGSIFVLFSMTKDVPYATICKNAFPVSEIVKDP